MYEKGGQKRHEKKMHTTVSINLGMFYANLSFGIWMVEMQNKNIKKRIQKSMRWIMVSHFLLKNFKNFKKHFSWKLKLFLNNFFYNFK